MTPGNVLLLTGPPGSGKTTIARMLAARSNPSVHLEADSFFRAIVEGFIEPWEPESNEQNGLVMRVVGDAAATYALGGYSTVVDGILIPGWFFEPLRDRLCGHGLRVSYAVLRPALDVALSRVKDRASSDRPVDEDAVVQLWTAFGDLGEMERHVVDAGHDDPAAIVRELERKLRDGVLEVT